MTIEDALRSNERIIELDDRIVCFANLDENTKESAKLFDEYIDRAIEFYRKHGSSGADGASR